MYSLLLLSDENGTGRYSSRNGGYTRRASNDWFFTEKSRGREVNYLCRRNVDEDNHVVSGLLFLVIGEIGAFAYLLRSFEAVGTPRPGGLRGRGDMFVSPSVPIGGRMCQWQDQTTLQN